MNQMAVAFIIVGILCLSISCAEENDNYRLPETIRATVYHLNITVYMVNDTFEGDLLFDFRVLIPTKSIEMHKSSKLNIKGQISLTLTGQKDEIAIKDYHENNDLLVIILKNELDPDLRYRLNITKFQGVINMLATGFYTYGYTDESGEKTKYAAAILKPAYARSVFPCLDEPAQKAIFKISITRPNDYKSMSNGLKIRSTRLGTKMTRDDFEDTPIMSTYLVSFLITQLTFSNKVVNIHRAVASNRAIKQRQTDYSITAADKILKKFEQYININYPLKHLYHVALPIDLPTNMALATWGLIVYKESFFLTTISPSSSKKEVINELIAHQIAHLYFENLITLKWWRHNWFHEGLSDFLSYKLVDEIYPKWLAKTNFKLKVLDALYQDSFPYSEELEGKELTPTQVRDNTHIILRPKGAAMTYMLESIVTPSVFKHGIRNFFKDNAYKNVEPTDLYIAMEYIPSVRKLPKKLESIMWIWETQIGYPVVHATRDYTSSNSSNIINLEQQPFVVKQSISEENVPKKIWFIPINYAVQNNQNFSDLEPKAWLHNRTAKIRIKDLNSFNSWLLINKQGAYFYRVNYDERNWNLIIKALLKNHTSIHVFHRMQLIDDCNALAQGDIIQYDELVAMLQYLPKETEYGPLSVLKKISVELHHRLSGTEAENYIYKYIGNPVANMYNQLKKKAQSSRDHILKMKLKLLFTWLCELNHTRCTSETRLYYGKFKSEPDIPPELEEQIFCTAIRMGDNTTWSSIFEEVKLSKNDEFPEAKFKALACTPDEQSLEKYLNYAKTLSSDRLALALLSVSDQIPVARFALPLLFTKLVAVTIKYVAPVAGFVLSKAKDAVLEFIGKKIGSKVYHDIILKDVTKIIDKAIPKRNRHLFEPGLELAKKNIEWRKKHVKEFTTFFRSYIYRSSGSPYYLSSLNIFVLVLHTLFITILN